MYLNEARINVLEVPKEYTLAHCISADLNITNEAQLLIDQKYKLRETIMRVNSDIVSLWDSEGMNGACILCNDIFNLVIKRKSEDKINYEKIKNALIVMKKICEKNGINKIAVPFVTFDESMNTDTVIDLIIRVFLETDIEVLLIR